MKPWIQADGGAGDVTLPELLQPRPAVSACNAISGA